MSLPTAWAAATGHPGQEIRLNADGDVETRRVVEDPSGELDWGPGNDGDTVRFYTCPICFAAVQRRDREKHEEWHGVGAPRMTVTLWRDIP